MRPHFKTSIKWIKSHWLKLIIGFLFFLGLAVYLNFIRTTVGFIQWSGFENKTLWDILELVIIPIVLIIVAYLFSRADRQAESQRAEERVTVDRAIATNNLQDAALQKYIEAISELLLEKKLSKAQQNSNVAIAARARTIATLRILDGSRKAILIRFLYEAELILGKAPILTLEKADLRWVNLSYTSLKNINLGGAFLHMANMSHSDLQSARLTSTILDGANLEDTNLCQADLSLSRLSGINFKNSDLSNAILHETNFTSSVWYREQVLEPTTYNDKDKNKYYAVLRASKLADVNLTNADLTGANLSGVDLTGANLEGANLTEANLGCAEGDRSEKLVRFMSPDEYSHSLEIYEKKRLLQQVYPTNLTRANLTNANFTKASLRYADLDSARCDGAILTEADLSRAKIFDEQLEKVSSLTGAVLPNGQKHEGKIF